MKIVRQEDGRFIRTVTLEINSSVVDTVNESLKKAIVNGMAFEPLTSEDIFTLMSDNIDAPRYREEYFVECEFYTGNMKLGDFVRCTINDIFAELPTKLEDETIEVWYDEFYP